MRDRRTRTILERLQIGPENNAFSRPALSAAFQATAALLALQRRSDKEPSHEHTRRGAEPHRQRSSTKVSSGCSRCCASQSISTDPAYKEQCRAAAEHRRRRSHAASASTPSVRPTEGHPVVVGKSATGTVNGQAPRVLFYGHYDVQPVDPLDCGRRRRSSRGSRRCPTAARSSSRAAPATTKARP